MLAVGDVAQPKGEVFAHGLVVRRKVIGYPGCGSLTLVERAGVGASQPPLPW
jgi:hypothetical protein